MTLDKKTNRIRRLTASRRGALRDFGSERPACAHGIAAPVAAGARTEAGRVWPRRVAACRQASRIGEARGAPRTQPIWLAALMAIECHAVANGEASTILWDCGSGRAWYTNRSAATELIRPLGVELPGGGTLAVSWAPGESAYTLEVFAGDAPRRS